MSKTKIYIAGSLFSEQNIRQRLFEEKEIEEMFGDKVEIYNPISAPFNTDKQSLPTPEEIYWGDFDEIRTSDIVLFDLSDMHDAGMILELGIVSGLNTIKDNKGITAIGVLSDIRLESSNKYPIPSYGMNHMVLGAFDVNGMIVNSFDRALVEIAHIVHANSEGGNNIEK